MLSFSTKELREEGVQNNPMKEEVSLKVFSPCVFLLHKYLMVFN